MKDEYATIREMGLPVTIEEMIVWYEEPPADENAADLYALAFERLVVPTKEQEDLLPLVGWADLPEPAEPLDAETMTLVARHLEKNAECLELLCEAAARPNCHWPVDFNDYWPLEETGQDHFESFRNAAGLLVLQVVCLIETGETKGAVDGLVASVGVARANARAPFVLSQLHGMWFWRIGYSGFERLLNRGLLKQDELARLDKALTEYEEYERFWLALVGELHCTLGLLDRMAPGPGSLSRLRNALSRVVYGVDEAHLMRKIPGFIEAAKTSPRAAYLKANEPAVPATVSEFVLKQEGFSNSVLDSISIGMKAYARTAAQRRMVQAAVAIERYRLDNAGLPDALADLVPEYLPSVPIDPFNGEPVRYRKTEPGYVVYSVALNEVDDGGVETEDGGKTGDIAFSVAR